MPYGRRQVSDHPSDHSLGVAESKLRWTVAGKLEREFDQIDAGVQKACLELECLVGPVGHWSGLSDRDAVDEHADLRSLVLLVYLVLNKERQVLRIGDIDRQGSVFTDGPSAAGLGNIPTFAKAESLLSHPILT